MVNYLLWIISNTLDDIIIYLSKLKNCFNQKNNKICDLVVIGHLVDKIIKKDILIKLIVVRKVVSRNKLENKEQYQNFNNNCNLNGYLD